MKHIVKRKGHQEEYDEKKVYASSYSACLNSHLPKEKTEKIAGRVTKEIDKWIENKTEVDSGQIFKEVTKSLEKIDPEVAFMYKTHRDLS